MKYLVACCAISAIAWLDTTALKAGIDGVALTTSVGLIAGIGTVFFLPSKDRAKAIQQAGRRSLVVLAALSPIGLAGCPGTEIQGCVEKDDVKACVTIVRPTGSPSPSASPSPPPDDP